MRRIVMIAVLVAAASDVQSQSLGDAAAKEKERRARTDKSSKTFTESDLQDAAKKRARESSPSSEASPSSPTGAAKRTPPPRSPDSPDPRTSEESKRARGAELRAQMAETITSLKQAEEELRAAEENWRMVSNNPFVVNRALWVDTERSLKRARSRLDAAQGRVETLRRQRDEIEAAARREGIPQQYYLP